MCQVYVFLPLQPRGSWCQISCRKKKKEKGNKVNMVTFSTINRIEPPRTKETDNPFSTSSRVERGTTDAACSIQCFFFFLHERKLLQYFIIAFVNRFCLCIWDMRDAHSPVRNAVAAAVTAAVWSLPASLFPAY